MKDQYLPYKPEDFATDELFLLWQSGEDPSVSRQWQEWVHAHPEMSPTIEEAKRLTAQMKFNPIQHHTNVDNLWNQIDRSIQDQDSSSVKTIPLYKKKSFIFLSSAAACLALILFFIWFIPQEEQVQTARAERITYTLPDRSLVQINSESNISFDKDNWANDRTLALEGEAFFSVEKGSPFNVNTPNGKVEVLGTSFNVFSRADKFQVTCATGKVRVVLFDPDTTFILTPGKSMSMRPGIAPSLINKDTTKIASWIEGDFQFEQAPVNEVFDELERQFNVQIELKASLSDSLYNGSFSSDSLEAALFNVCWPLSLAYNIEGEHIIITKEE